MSSPTRTVVHQSHPLAKRLLMSPTAPIIQRWALSGTPTQRKAFALRRFVLPPVGAAARDFERRVEPGFVYAGNTQDLLGLMVHFFGVWEPNLSAFIQGRLQQGDTFIDVGANSGWFTAMGAALVGPTGRVVGVEASPVIAARLQANLNRNGFSHARVVNAAATSEPCLVDIVPGPAEHTGLTHIEKSHSSDAVQVRGDTLPSLLTDEEIASARLVKIDVEGAEYDVIAGLAPALSRFPESCEFVVEVGPDRAESTDQIDGLLAAFTDAGYTPYVLPNFYDVHSYMLTPVATQLPRLVGRPATEVDVVFSRASGETLSV